MSDPVVSAAIPELVAAIKAIQNFITNMGTNPAQWTLKFPGAVQVLIGTVELQVPVLASAEAEALASDINSKLDGWVQKLQAKA